MAKLTNARAGDSKRVGSISDTLRYGASALAICAVAFSATPAPAQDDSAADQTDDTSPDTIVVTGIRGSLQSAQEIKRNADQIVDSITSVDIGALPDRSVTEALQRVPGVAIARTPELRDPVRFAAEGSGVVVRGMTQVRSELNGRDAFTANQGRGLSFEDVPPELMAGVDVYKNPSADIIEGGIGGTVDLRTRLPFDTDGRTLAFSADGSYGDLREEWTPSYSALYSDRFDTGIGEIGVLFDYAYSELATRTDTVSIAPFYERCQPDDSLDAASYIGFCHPSVTIDTQNALSGQPLGTKYYIPGALSWRSLDWDRTREGLYGAVQWAPTDTVQIYATYFRSEATQESRERAAWSNAGGNDIQPLNYDFNNLTFDDNNVFVSGGLTGGAGDFAGSAFGFGADSRFAVRNSVTTDVSGGVRWDASDRLAVIVDAQYVEATTDSLDFTVFNRYDFPAFNLDLSNGIPAVTFAPDDYGLSQANTYWSAAMDHHDDNDGDQLSLRADIEYTFENDTWLDAFRAGVRTTDRENINRETNWNWGFISEWWGGTVCPRDVYPSPTDPDDPNFGCTQLAYMDRYEPEMSHLYSFPDFMRGEAGLPSALWFPNMALVERGPTDAYEIIQGLQTFGWGWAPFNGDYENSASVSYDGDTVTGLGGGINNQKEETQAVYAMIQFGSDDFLGSGLAWDGNAGLRYVETDVTANGFMRFPTLGTCSNCTADEYAFANGAQVDKTFENTYENVLPSFNLRVHLSDDLQWRFAASKAMTRPNLAQLQPILAIGASTVTGAGGTELDSWNGYAGNPLLDPVEANQFDTSLEWYFASGGSLYGTLFYKDISNFIVSTQIPYTITNNGVTQTVNLVTPTNLEQATIQGFEIGYQQFYDMLPQPFDGLGLQANFTYVDSEGGGATSASPFDPTQVDNSQVDGLPLEGLSKTSYNIAALYEKGPVSARLAYNWREQYLLTTSQANDNNAGWAADYGQLDGSVFYSLNDNWKIGLQGVNLLDETTEIFQQDLTDVHLYTQNLPSMLFDHHWHKTDRRYSIVVRATF